MRKKLSFTIILFILFFIVIQQRSYSFAQKSASVDLPSDLSLDLALAEQNPAPGQKQIVESQTKQVITTTNKGEISVDIPKDEVPLEIKTESVQNVVNPEQITSEQVISTPESVEEKTNLDENEVSPTEQIEPSTSQINNTNTDVIPGTSILEPDDNAVPTEPILSITPQNSDISPSNTPNGDQKNPEVNQQDTATPGQENSIPLENGNSAITEPPAEATTVPTAEPTTSSVQGAETGQQTSLWQIIINLIFGK